MYVCVIRLIGDGFFYGQMTHQQCQSTEGSLVLRIRLQITSCSPHHAHNTHEHYETKTQKIRTDNTHTQPFSGLFSRTTRVGRYQKDKPFWILLKQEMTRWQWHAAEPYAVKSFAPRSRQITTPAPHHSIFFIGRMPFVLPNQQRQGTEGTSKH